MTTRLRVIVASPFLIAMNKHSLGACPEGLLLEPKRVIEALIDLSLRRLRLSAPHAA